MKTFKDLWQSKSHLEKLQLAEDLDTSMAYLSQIANGHRKAGKHFRKVIMFKTNLKDSAFGAAA